VGADGTVIVTFQYDPFGRRIAKKVTTRGDSKAENKIYTYVYDGSNIIIGYLTKKRGWATRTSASRYIQGPGIDRPLALEQNGKVYYYHADGLGSIVALTDSRQKVVESYEYDSFGYMKRHGELSDQPFTFTGRERDDETGLYYYRARYYDPQIGRFISKDPIGFKGGLNLYAYVGNNPVREIDPYGLAECEPLYTPLYSPPTVTYVTDGLGGFYVTINEANPVAVASDFIAGAAGLEFDIYSTAIGGALLGGEGASLGHEIGSLVSGVPSPIEFLYGGDAW
jgi:RHS repeat-associated protein